MEAIVLAAGIGSRLSRYTRNVPKCFLPIKYGQMVIDRLLSQFGQNGIERVTIVLGYQAETGQGIIKELEERYPKLELKTVVNIDYRSTGTLASLLIGYGNLKSPDAPFFLAEGDVICDDEIVALLVDGSGNRLAVDYDNSVDEEVMKFRVVDGNVVALSKALPATEAQGEFCGLAVINGKELNDVLPMAHEFLSSNKFAYYDDFFNHLVQAHLEIKFSAVAVEPYRWTEIDFSEDYKQARQIFAEHEPVNIDPAVFAQALHSPSIFALASDIDVEIVDFCFSSNPYLVADQILKERLSWELPTLISMYPPEQPMLRKLVATFHQGIVHPENILVTNGASEAVGLLKHICRHLILPIPTFGEYLNATAELTCYERLPENGFDLSVSDLIAFSCCTPADGLVLINPANPVGRLLNRTEIETVAKELTNKIIIVDESSIEFSEESQSMLGRLSDYPNLLIIKSYGKALGVSGVRIGAIFGSSKLLGELSRFLPVWNVNSIASFFLRVLSEEGYRLRYWESIRSVKAATQLLYKELSKLSDYIQVFPVISNSVFARLVNGMDSTELRDELLQNRIYIRDCKSALGLDGSYIQIASRTSRENLNLVRQLTTVLVDHE